MKILCNRKLNEKIEVHDSLNSKIWDGDTLKKDVKDAISNIVDKYVEDSEILTKDSIIDVELVGSNASYNYTDDSDLDIHIIVNFESISSDPAILQVAMNGEKTLFNDRYDISVKGINTELYVEDVKTSAVSNGVYSVTNDSWVKKPNKIDTTPTTDSEEYVDSLSKWKSEALAILDYSTKEEAQKFIDNLYNLRRTSIMKDGEYSVGNLVFKEIRNEGILQKLKDYVNQLTSKELSVEGLKI